MNLLKSTLPFPKTQTYARLFTTESNTWLPKKRVSRMTMDKIRSLNASQPDIFNTVKLSEEFKLSVEAIRRILKSKYRPSPENAERQEKNRYEAMGERRKQFQKEYETQSRDILKRIPKNLEENDAVASITNKREIKATWKNEHITRAGWKTSDDTPKSDKFNGTRLAYNKPALERPSNNRYFDKYEHYNTREGDDFRNRDSNRGNRRSSWRNDDGNHQREWKERRSSNSNSNVYEFERNNKRGERDGFKRYNDGNRDFGWRNNNDQDRWSGKRHSSNNDRWSDSHYDKRRGNNSFGSHDGRRKSSSNNRNDGRED